MGVVAGIVIINIFLLIVCRHQLGFRVQACPVIRPWQVDDGLQVNSGGFRHTGTGIYKMHGLTINTGVERTHVILVPVNVQLRLGAIGTRRLVGEHLELLVSDRRIEVLNRVANAEDLRGITVGTRTVFG